MQIAKDRVVTINYTLTDANGTLIDSSEGREPLAYLHGAGNIIPGLERALEGKQSGDSLSVTVAPEDAYGERDDALLQVVPRDRFESPEELEIGMAFQTPTEHGIRVVTIVGVDHQDITVDGNHPLAGETLNFAVSVVEVREASDEELHHGHVHGPGGHAH